MYEMRSNRFETSDLGLACYLALIGEDPVEFRPEMSGRCVLIYLDNVRLQGAVEKYWNKRCRVEPLEMLGKLRQLKARIQQVLKAYE